MFCILSHLDSCFIGLSVYAQQVANCLSNTNLQSHVAGNEISSLALKMKLSGSCGVGMLIAGMCSQDVGLWL